MCESGSGGGAVAVDEEVSDGVSRLQQPGRPHQLRVAQRQRPQPHPTHPHSSSIQADPKRKGGGSRGGERFRSIPFRQSNLVHCFNQNRVYWVYEKNRIREKSSIFSRLCWELVYSVLQKVATRLTGV